MSRTGASLTKTTCLKNTHDSQFIIPLNGIIRMNRA
jgi:hypothetical protein